MIISRTPYRISFFGGGTDYPAWFQKHGGTVLATTIDKYCYISCRYLPQFFEHKHRIIYSKSEMVKNISEIQHPAVRALFEDFKIEKGLEIHHDGDLPSRTGIGSSSSFAVGLIHSLKALNNQYISKEKLAQEAIRLEQELLKESVGSQDQISASYGGLNQIEFNQDGSFSVTPIFLEKNRKQEVESSMLLFFTGIHRTASDVAKSQIENFGKRETELRAIREIAKEASALIQTSPDPVKDFGTMMQEAWKLKRSLSSTVTNNAIDLVYSAGMDAGALGGKILGAGGGGFILFIARPENKSKIIAKLNKLLHVDFKFESSGSKIIFYDQ